MRGRKPLPSSKKGAVTMSDWHTMPVRRHIKEHRCDVDDCAYCNPTAASQTESFIITDQEGVVVGEDSFIIPSHVGGRPITSAMYIRRGER